ncbi:PREDICTED: uncharacterized protein LOC104754446 [Camelina sativa]|uniref:Uncharacterized protein LOC104754446 n=1 Tax=Camelina sativa TaxID=90675 RepID=A0ABM1QIG8_CAMSA|nr:PREDICTED: uncharacterized protein LOC104754446 [Camelina sativa]
MAPNRKTRGRKKKVVDNDEPEFVCTLEPKNLEPDEPTKKKVVDNDEPDQQSQHMERPDHEVNEEQNDEQHAAGLNEEQNDEQHAAGLNEEQNDEQHAAGLNEEQNDEQHAAGLNEEELEGEVELSGDHDCRPKKKQRGPTRMKNIAKDSNTREHVQFTEMGEPYGRGSVKLSSYLGTLVREHVPIIIEDWRKVSEELRTVLWKSIQARFDVDDDYQKVALLKQMGCLWRAYKARIVQKINTAKTNQQRINLRPKNISPTEWQKFVKFKTSQVVSDQYKKRRSMQIPHTCSRKGMVRLAEEMKEESSDPSEVTRLKVWVKSHTKKDGMPVNTNAAAKFRKTAELVDTQPESNSTNPKDDLLSQLLGTDNPGRLRAMGRGMSMSKLACFQVKNKNMAEMQAKQVLLLQTVKELREEIAEIKNKKHEPGVGENSAARTVNRGKSQPKCVLVDWAGTDDNVVEGLVLSTDPADFVNDIPLGPNHIKVLVETAIKPDAYLWKPAINVFNIEQAVGLVILI